MEEKREPLSEMAIERKIQILRNKHMDSEVIALVKSDYEYGLESWYRVMQVIMAVHLRFQLFHYHQN